MERQENQGDDKLVNCSLIKKLESYTRRYQDRPEVLDSLKQLLDSDAPIHDVLPLTPYDECDVRLAYARKFEQLQCEKTPGWRFNPELFAAFLVLPLHLIKSHLDIDGLDVGVLYGKLESLAEATRYFLLSQSTEDTDQAPSTTTTPQRKAGQQSQHGSPLGLKRRIVSEEAGPSKKPRVDSPATPPPLSPATSPPTSLMAGSPPSTMRKARVVNPISGRISRSKTAKEKAKALLGSYCLVTQVEDIQMAHIIPFCWNSNESRRAKTQSLMGSICEMLDLNTLLASFFWCNLGSSDQEWNIMPLSPGLHLAWGKAYFGFRHIGMDPVEENPVEENPAEETKAASDPVVCVQLQFVWMSRKMTSRGHTGKPVCLKSVAVDLASEQQAYQQIGTSSGIEEELKASSIVSHATGIGKIPDRKRVFDVTSTAQVHSGQIFKVQMPFSLAEKFTTAIKIQWALISIAAISGAADAVEHGWRGSPPEEPGIAVLGGEYEEVFSEWEQENDELTEDERDDDTTEEEENIYESVEPRSEGNGQTSTDGENLTFSFDLGTVSSAATVINNSMYSVLRSLRGDDDLKHFNFGALWLVDALYGRHTNITDPKLQTEGIQKYYQGVAISLSNHLRSTSSIGPLLGTAWREEVYVNVRWEWLAFLAAELILTGAFILATIIATRALAVPVLKSSALAALLAPDKQVQQAMGAVDDITVAENKAKLIHARFDNRNPVFVEDASSH